MHTYQDLITALNSLDPPPLIFGGFAEDVLLNGSPIHPHGDLDILIARADLPRHRKALNQFGFPDLELLFAPVPDFPLIYHTTIGELNLEITLFDRDDSGPHFILATQHGTSVHVDVTGDIFAWPPITAAGTTYRIVSPLALYQIRQTIIDLGIMGPPRPKDLANQNELRTRFLADLPAADLNPKTTPFVV